MPRKRVRVRGRVHGVGFRYTARREAERLGVLGWIRNLRDGRTVELVVLADGEPLEAFLAWCRVGPSHARVDRVDLEDEDDAEPFTGFEIRPTA